jgi:hypothetical protein
MKMDDDKMIENAAMIGLSRSNGSIELPEWINDRKKPSVEEILATDYGEPVTLKDIGSVAWKVVTIAFVIGVILAAWA